MTCSEQTASSLSTKRQNGSSDGSGKKAYSGHHLRLNLIIITQL